MKKTMIFLAVAMATVFTFSSCQKEYIESNVSESGIRVITAEFENNATKTTLNSDGKTPEWAVGDVIRVLSSSTYKDITLVSGSGTPEEGQGIIANNAIVITIPAAMTGTLYAVYPASATTMTSCNDGNINFTIPAIKDGTFASANICVAKSSTTDGTNKDNLVFRNATAVLKIKTAADVVGVDITATNSIAGPVTASFSGTELSLTTTSLDKSSVSAVGTSAPSDGVFYLATAPVTATGSTATCYKIDKKGSINKDNKELVRNVIYSMNLSSMTINTDCDLTGTKGVLNGHEYVIIKAKYGGTNDSYLKWATTNLGASNPQDYGDLYSWGETSPKSDYSKSKYSSTAEAISSDISPTSVYDAARVNWGGSWRMPTKDEFVALAANCVWFWTFNYNSTGKSGYIVYVAKRDFDKGKVNMNGTWKKWVGSSYSSCSEATDTYDVTDPHMFFPATGESSGTSNTYVGSSGNYWSSSFAKYYTTLACRLYFTSSNVNPQGTSHRSNGHSVRPVSD